MPARRRRVFRKARATCTNSPNWMFLPNACRATERIGKERVAERNAQAAAYEALSIPARRTVPADQPTPAVACVQMDGGRLQFFDRAEPQRNEDETFWREMKVGCLWSMSSNVSTDDPCPQLPASFVDPGRMQRMVREIKGFSGPDGSADEATKEERIDERPGRPRPLARSVVASRHGIETFGKLLASEAHQRRFVAAPRKAFVADGSDSNWGVWRRHFSDYVPILDFIHALTYVYNDNMHGAPCVVPPVGHHKIYETYGRHGTYISHRSRYPVYRPRVL